MKTLGIIASVTLLCLACKNKPATPTKTETPKEVKEILPEVKKTPFTQKIEQAHQINKFLSHKLVQYDIELSFGGQERLNATITQMTDDSKIKIEHKSGATVYFDGDKVYGFPKGNNFKGARFDIFTWSYFFALPYKLNDPGTAWNNDENHKWGQVEYTTSKLTFGNSVGDTPKDWYVIYKNPTTNVLEGAAYIVSFGKELEKAEADPHAIRFSNFVTVAGAPFATKWTFHNWSLENGYTDVLGEAKISNIKFADTPDTFFTKPPADAELISLPAK